MVEFGRGHFFYKLCDRTQAIIGSVRRQTTFPERLGQGLWGTGWPSASQSGPGGKGGARRGAGGKGWRHGRSLQVEIYLVTSVPQATGYITTVPKAPWKITGAVEEVEGTKFGFAFLVHQFPPPPLES